MVSLFALCNITNNLVKVSNKPSERNICQIFHIYQTKNLYIKHFENQPKFSNLVDIYIPVGNTA